MIREIRGRALAPGMNLALPFGREATVTEVVMGTRWVRYHWASTKPLADGWRRILRTDPILIEVTDASITT